MSLKSLVHRVILACCFTTLAGCIEYRFDHFGGRDQYIGWVTTDPRLDPKLGSKTKLYLGVQGPVQPYLGAHFSRKRLTTNVGVIHYLSRNASLELGYRFNVYVLSEQSTLGDKTGNLNWHSRNENNLLYFGGRINF